MALLPTKAFWPKRLFTLFILLSVLHITSLVSAQTITCSKASPCVNNACCSVAVGSTEGICGYGPFCNTTTTATCVSNCDAKAECGKYAKIPGATCPLSTCCSEWGFCGTTTEFCADLCQNNCFEPTVPSCTSNDVLKKVIGYYESWSSDRACDGWGPSDISANGLTHVFYSFALFEEYDSDWNVYIPALDQAQTEAEKLKPFMALKKKNPGISTVISVGGWSFNDPPTAGYWSTMSSTAAGRNSFAKNLLAFMVLYGFDGVDLDWEYPGASDRGGDTTLWVDSDNYIALIREIRMVFDATGTAYTISFTTPASYWYLQTFQVNEMLSAGADWTMMMTYDLHGVWDGDDPYIGKIIGSHTNLTEIKVGLDLLWRTNVDPSQVFMGIGFYGRSFTLSDIGCQDPGCPFDSAGVPGVCTATAGILSYKEITAIVTAGEGTPVWNEEAAVNYLTFADNQWVSYDNNVTFKQKVDYANQICLGGVGIWAIDLDTYDWQALSALTGKDINGGSLLTSGGDPTELASAYNAYTGADCYVSGCVDWNTGSCKAGYSVLDYVHSGSMGVIEDPDKNLCRRDDVSVEESTDSQYRLICCPTDAMPVSCSWEGAGAGVGLALFPQFCKGGGSGFCGAGKFELIADSYTERTGSTPCILNKRSLCCATDPELELCSWTACGGSCLETQYKNPNTSVYGGSNLNQDSELCADGANPAGPSSFCCPSKDTYTGCAWYGDDYCTKSCPSDKILITQRSEIEDLQIEQGLPGGYDECVTGYLKYCCDPPTATTDWPVSPTDLFEYPDTTHVSYEYVKEDSSYDDYDREEDGPFAFVMIDGDTAAYSESLVDQWGFLDDDSNLSKRKIKKRDMFTKQNDTFDNVVETYTIKCLNLAGCEGLFEKGASNTIVKLPDSIGAGPYARIISLEPIGSTKRSSNIVPRSVGDTYNLVVDYDLAGAAVEQKGDVNFRIDYSNLVDYWADVTDTPAKNRKRWFGAFKAWLAKVTTMVKSDTGFLPLEYEENIKLFHFAKTCPKTNLKTTLDLDANIHMGLYAQYAYYFEGSILPTPTLIASYGYFSVSPAAAILMTLRGEAIIQTNSDVVNILSGITLPGLSIKGLISIGPEFDLTGSMDASLQVSGELNAGVSVAWPKAEVFFPQDSDGTGATIPPGTLDDPNDPDKQQTFSVVPTFDASITAVGNLALTLTPQVKFGISVLGDALMSGYVTAGVANTITLGLSAGASVSSTTGATAEFCYWADYVYSVFLSADVSFANGLAYWGNSIELASPEDPLVLIDKTCVDYSSTPADKRKRDDANLVPLTTGTPCFGGLISCEDTVDNTTCAVGGPSSKRDTSTCYLPPALFYNCAFFQPGRVVNDNENTRAGGAYEAFISICQNVRGYLQDNNNGQTIGSNWMQLTYLPGGGTNRNDACKDVSAVCAFTKSYLWPTAVFEAALTAKKDDKAYMNMAGYSDSISCDEFPFNASEEGGSGANAACVTNDQQFYQGQINNLVSNIYDLEEDSSWSPRAPKPKWNGGKRLYTINLFDSSTNGNDLSSPYAGTWKSSANTPSGGLTQVVGGINLQGNPQYQLGVNGDVQNGICMTMPRTMTLAATQKFYKLKVQKCFITFETPEDLTRRGLDPQDPQNWQIKSVQLEDDDEELIKTENDGFEMDIIEEITKEIEVLDIAKKYPAEAVITPSPRLGPGHVHGRRHY